MPDWQQIQVLYQTTLKPIREIGRDHSVSDTAIRKKAKKDKWTRPDPPPDLDRREPIREAKGPVIEAKLQPAALPGAVAPPVFDEIASAPAELRKRGLSIVLALMAELEVETANIDLLEALAEIETVKDHTPHRRRALMKALSFPTRAQAAKNLASALSTLTEALAAPGKKEQAKAAAASAGQNSEWSDDLNVGFAAPH